MHIIASCGRAMMLAFVAGGRNGDGVKGVVTFDKKEFGDQKSWTGR